eukprot:3473601-Karenia_brevis.AAC.1
MDGIFAHFRTPLFLHWGSVNALDQLVHPVELGKVFLNPQCLPLLIISGHQLTWVPHSVGPQWSHLFAQVGP